MVHNFNRYLSEMSRMGYTSSYEVLNAMDFGLPQKRERVFTISELKKDPFNFMRLERRECPNLREYLDDNVSDFYTVTQPSVIAAIGSKGIKRATVIKDFCYTITERQDRMPAQIIDLGNGKYRYLTEKECWRLFGYEDSDYENAANVNNTRTLYKQAGNSIPVPIFESIFKAIC